VVHENAWGGLVILSFKRSIKDHIHIQVHSYEDLVKGLSFEEKKKPQSNLLFGKSIKMVTFLIIARWGITARVESGSIYSYSVLFYHKAAWSDFPELH